jgi:hypothetical protein
MMPNFTDLELSSSYRSFFGLYIGSVAAANYLNFKDLGFLIKSYQGAGLPQLTHSLTPYGTRGWETYQGTIVDPRLYILVGVIEGDSLKDITQKRQRLISLLAPVSGIAPLVYLSFQLVDRYGASVGRELTVPVHYTGGLEGSTDNIWDEPIALTFREHAPSQVVESGTNTLNFPTGIAVPGLSSSINTFYYRGLDATWTRYWTNLYTFRSVLWDSLGDLWAGANGNVFRKSFSTTTPFITARGSSPIYSLIEGPDSNIYIAGNGIPERWLRASATWQVIGNSSTFANILSSVVIPSPAALWVNRLYVVGSFTSPTNRFAYINYIDDTANTGAWTTPFSTGPNGDIITVCYHPGTKLLYLGGSFTTFEGVTVNHICTVDPSTHAVAAVSTGANGDINKISVMSDGRLLLTGAFTTIGGKSIYRQAIYDGYSFQAVGGSNPNHSWDSSVGIYQTHAINPTNGMIFTQSFTGEDSLFNGVDWGYGEISNTYQMAAAAYSPTGELAVCLAADTAASGYVLSAPLGVPNLSTTDTWPQFKFNGNPGIYALFNYQTGKVIQFDSSISKFWASAAYATLQAGGPDGMSFQSSYFGNLMNHVIKGSDISDFNLKPGSNWLGALVTVTQNASNYVQLSWKTTHWSFDASTIGV